MKRREFLATTGAAMLTPCITNAAAPMELIAEPVLAVILPDSAPPAPMFGFNGSTPGPVLRARQGDMLDIRFRNQLDQASAVHWHGVRLENAMDGVPMLTQDVVAPNAEFSYRFHAPDAGTFWYHSHNRSSEQVARGLYGPLIVEEATPPDVDHDFIVMLDDWRLTEDGRLAGDFNNMHDQAHQGRLGNFARAMIEPPTPVRQGDRVRLRLINVATDRLFPLAVEGVSGKVVALDGMPLATPEALSNIAIAPAQRVDIIADITAEDQAAIVVPTRDGPYNLGSIAVSGKNSARQPSEISALPQNNLPSPDMDSALSLTLRMEGGAMRPPAGSDIWAFNGQSDLGDIPFHRFERGQTARLQLINDTAFPHGIHLHGHHFHELDPDGDLAALRDTSLVEPGRTREIVCVFDNPGKWLLHCHMLGHQASGMKTWVEVL